MTPPRKARGRLRNQAPEPVPGTLPADRATPVGGDAAADAEAPEPGHAKPGHAKPGDAQPGTAPGVATIRAALRTMPGVPGVYRMMNARGEVLYVGKARNLRRRVFSYTQFDRLPNRLQRMVAETTAMEIVTTHTEVEALLLESNLIKRHMPRFNVLLRDDKSFPYILLTGDHAYPQITKYRGARNRKGDYFGPFASAGAVNETLTTLQRAFLLRSCTDAVFSSRTRPCLLYQIKRCSAPCVGRIGKPDYDALVAEAGSFLSGRSSEAQRDLAARMEAASSALEFEKAAVYRDRIRALTQVQARQDINLSDVDAADVIAAHQAAGQTCIEVFFFRAGRNYGNHAYFPRHERHLPVDEVLSAFLGQFYDNKTPPPLILLSHAPAEQALLAEALSLRAGRKVTLTVPQRGAKRKPVDHARANAEEALGRRLAESSAHRQLLEGVAAAFQLEAPPQRIEVYDNSHISGRHAVGAMIVAGPEGLVKNAYRKFTIRTAAAPPPRTGTRRARASSVPESASNAGAVQGLDEASAGLPLPDPERSADAAGISAGDDYGMMREVLTRRFSRVLREDPDRSRGQWPDLLLIDGGLGQLNAARGVLAELGIEDVPLVGIAKGPDRDAGRERFFLPDRPPFSLEPRDPVLYFLQRLRDEAHRFAIGTHRAKRSKALGASPLDEVPGIGTARKRSLLNHFGSAREVSRAGLADLEAVPGISHAVARRIYDHFHPDA